MGSSDCSAFLVEGRLGKQRLEEEEKELLRNERDGPGISFQLWHSPHSISGCSLLWGVLKSGQCLLASFLLLI